SYHLNLLLPKQVAEDRVDLLRLRYPAHGEVEVGALYLFVLDPQAAVARLVFVRALDIGEVAREWKQILAQKPCALRRIGAEGVSVGGLRSVDVPFRPVVSRFTDLVHQLQRRVHHGASTLRVVEERVFVDLLRFVGMTYEHELDPLVLTGQKQIQQREE